MPSTTNFGWTTPADTDLVKDGAAAIRTLGNGIDTSFLDLKGGSSGQILAKNSATDLDFVWIANDQGDITAVTAGTGISGGGTSGAVTITNSMATAIDAKGDLVVGTGADTFSRLAVGTNGQVLTADSGEATGLKFATPVSGGANWSLLNAGGTALTGATTITVSGISGKDKIMVIVEGASASASSFMGVVLNGNTGNDYYQYGLNIYMPSTYAAANYQLQSGVASRIRLAYQSNNAASIVSGYVLLSGCNSSGVKVFNSLGSANVAGGENQESFDIGGYYDSASTISSVALTSSAGNFDAGTLFIYTSA